jgi:acetoin utilization deacetylase AcuC-like enzyme
MVNVPLPAMTSGKSFRQSVGKEFAPALEKFKPEMVFVSAGFDAHALDPLAELRLVREDYVWITEFIKDVAARHAKGRIVSMLEGGYDLPSLADSATAHVKTLAGI